MGMYSTIYRNDLVIPPIKTPIKVDKDNPNYQAFEYVTSLLEMDVNIDTAKELGKRPVDYVIYVDNIRDSTANEMKMHNLSENFPKFIKLMNEACESPVTGDFIKVDEEHNFVEYEVKSDGSCFVYEIEMKPVRKKASPLN